MYDKDIRKDEEMKKRLIEMAIEKLPNSYAPYSRYNVAAAALFDSGNIYTGVNVESASLGMTICAERNAIFNMITNGEYVIEKVIAILPDGSSGAPCGACRELMVQLMPENYKGVEVMMDYKRERIVTLGELTPEWWIG